MSKMALASEKNTRNCTRTRLHDEDRVGRRTIYDVEQLVGPVVLDREQKTEQK
jgi:hypothetical protein